MYGKRVASRATLGGFSTHDVVTDDLYDSVIQRLPTNSQGKEVESSDANGDDENDNRKSHNFNVIV